MEWIWKGQRRKEHGFTLIELVVVLAIIGILIAAAVPLYLGARIKAYRAEAQNTLQELKTMEWAYYQQYNSFTGTTDSNLGFSAPASANWAWTAAGAAGSATMTATGSTGTPVSGSTVTLTLVTTGATTQSASF
ncbi:MAG TPA: prepilin-type N-terminal cleavage/methylation domain-containing protein [bacterium]|nr:prepilin-type N-terminal cleavage/methylation domain-containing protein [bacterium]